MRERIVTVLPKEGATFGPFAVALGGAFGSDEDYAAEAVRCAAVDGMPEDEAESCRILFAEPPT